MGSIFVHVSIVALAYIFPNLLSPVPILIGALFPDIEYIFLFVFGWLKEKKLQTTIDLVAKTGILHSIFGTLFISLPICYLLSSFYVKEHNLLISSILVGLFLHLIIDLPAHPTLMLLWPFKRFDKNPFLIKKETSWIKRIYPYKYLESKPYQYLSEFKWSIISFGIPLILVLVLFFMRVL